VSGRTGFWSLLSQLGPQEGGEAPEAARGGGRPGRAAAGSASTESEAGSAPGVGAKRPPVRVLLADDHRVVREGLKMTFDG